MYSKGFWILVGLGMLMWEHTSVNADVHAGSHVRTKHKARLKTNHHKSVPTCYARRIDPYKVYISPQRHLDTAQKWLIKMGTDPGYANAFTRCLAKRFKQNDLEKIGFRLTLGVDEFGQFVLVAHQPMHKVFRQPISPMMSYNPANLFRYRVDITNPFMKLASKHTITLKSWEANYIQAPKGPYVSIVDFAHKATAAEITDFWRMLYQNVIWLKKQHKRLKMHTDAGTASGQEFGQFQWFIDDVTYENEASDPV